MIAQTIVEYGALHSISNGFANTWNSTAQFLQSGDSKYLVIAIVAVLVLMLVTHRRAS